MKHFLLCGILCVFLGIGMLLPQRVEAFCGPPNILLIQDRSGSMTTGTPSKWTDAKTAITTITNTYATQVQFGLITFSDDATIDAPIPATAAAIQQALNIISPLGQTFMVKAMDKAKAHLSDVLSKDKEPDRPTSIVFITDGEPSDRCPVAEVTAFRKLVVSGRTYDVKTYVIGFGSLVNRDCLNQLADAGGTALAGSIRYYVANNATDLAAAIKKVIDDSVNSNRIEICDNRDNDCDGQIDENLTRPCTSSQNCPGTQTCTAGVWGACNAPAPTPEVCDNKDNNCNGTIDENLTQPCTNDCGTGTQVCNAGKWGACNATGTRACTNDCGSGNQSCSNGQWSACDATGTRSCTNACGTGTQSCKNNTWGDCQPGPTPEVCDGKDNDCDGVVDNGLTRDCLPCGTETCTNGQWGPCVQGTAVPEECNNKDDDCDGKIDNFTRSCTNDCGTGNELCTNGKWGACDATGTRSCTNACGTGTQECKNNKWGDCLPGPTTEICDGKDNDCDGSVDEGLTRSCTDSKKCTGVQTCTNGVWGTCVADAPSPEVCDGKDNDCNGKIDDNLTQVCTVQTCKGT